MKRTNYSTHTIWEQQTGYSRAVKIGHHIIISGTTAVDEEGIIRYPKQIEQQTLFIFEKIKKTLEALGGGLENVVRTRAFTTDIQQFEGFSKVHHQFFIDILPTCTLVEVSALVHPDLMIEIEVDAYV